MINTVYRKFSECNHGNLFKLKEKPGDDRGWTHTEASQDSLQSRA